MLLLLPTRDLLLSQRVSTKFRDTIKGSIRLQGALFFAPQPHISSYGPTNPTRVILNSAITDMIRANGLVHFKVGDTYVGVWDLSARLVRKWTSGVNRLALREVRVCLSISEIGYYVEAGEKICIPGSWEDMFACQPTCKVWVSLERYREIGEGSERGFDMQGTLGEMMKQAEKSAVV